jgi:ureidoglycolate dehydrogenase (NAD+)
MPDLKIKNSETERWAIEIFEASGLERAQSQIIAKSLVQTSLWGIDSHGISRIGHYLTRFETGSIAKNPKISFTQTGAATGMLDGGDGHGIVLLTQATNHAIELAKFSGTGVVGVSNSSHCGAIGLYTRQITQAGMIGIAFTHSDALVVPHGGNKAFFGTNPISIAFPTEIEEEPLCLDMATSIVPWNYIMNAKREKAEVPLGFGVNEHGEDTVQSAEIVAVKPTSFHKGYALAFLIDMLCGPLNGMKFGPHLTPMYQNLDEKRGLGSLVIAIDPERFAGLDFVKAACSAAIEQVKLQGKAILFPGEPEYQSARIRKTEGIPVTETLVAEFEAWSKKLNIKAPEYQST